MIDLTKQANLICWEHVHDADFFHPRAELRVTATGPLVAEEKMIEVSDEIGRQLRHKLWSELYGDLSEDFRNLWPLLEYLRFQHHGSAEFSALVTRLTAINAKLEPPK